MSVENRIKFIGAHIKELGSFISVSDAVGTFEHGTLTMHRRGGTALLIVRKGVFVIDLYNSAFINFDEDYTDLETIYNMLGDNIKEIGYDMESAYAVGERYNIRLDSFDLERTVNNYRIRMLIEKYYFTVPEMSKLLHATNCMIVGGAALAVLAPDIIESDIDIFLHCPKFRKFVDLAVEKLHNTLTLKNYKLVSKSDSWYTGTYINSVRTYELNDRKIQIVLIEACATSDDLFAKIDIDVCKVVLSPKTNGTFEIIASSGVRDKIKRRKMSIDFRTPGIQKRIEKYKAKGFTLVI